MPDLVSNQNDIEANLKAFQNLFDHSKSFSAAKKRIRNIRHFVVSDGRNGPMFCPGPHALSREFLTDTINFNVNSFQGLVNALEKLPFLRCVGKDSADHDFLDQAFKRLCDNLRVVPSTEASPEKDSYRTYWVLINNAEIDNPEELRSWIEGATKEVFVNRYERNQAARRECIRHHGQRCVVCELDFGETYGDRGEGFIHVHHVVPLSQIGERYEVNPITDLVPVCPNCHAMLHRGDSCLSVNELKSLLKTG